MMMNSFGVGLAMLLGASIAGAPAQAEGRFVVVEPEFESSEIQADVEALHKSGVLQKLVDAINRQFIIPRDVKVRFSECGESNAYFYEDRMEISMCLELLAEMEQDAAQFFPDESERDAVVAGAFTSILLHEVGHALVAVLQIPITGREEDAVDQLSAWVLIEAGMADAVLSSAATYYTEEGSADGGSLAGVHSLDQQRYFNMVCWVYGSNPAAFAELAEELELPAARAELCGDEYEQLRTSWTRLLTGHLRG